jgi:hypothetical protein
MRSFLLAIALFVALLGALLGALGLGFARPALAVHAVPAHSHLLVASSPTPYEPVCPGGSSGSCG